MGIHGAEDQPPRSESVRAPALRFDKTVVGASANAIAEPLGQLVLIWRRPSAVDLEPLMRVADRFRCVHAHGFRITPMTCLPCHRPQSVGAAWALLHPADLGSPLSPRYGALTTWHDEVDGVEERLAWTLQTWSACFTAVWSRPTTATRTGSRSDSVANGRSGTWRRCWGPASRRQRRPTCWR